jgi:hypothetical protein
VPLYGAAASGFSGAGIVKITNASAWLGAILLGALIPALIVACMFQEIRILPLAFAVTLGHAVFLGLLVALILRAKRKMQFIPILAGGFLVGGLPGGLFTWPLSPLRHTSASSDGVQTVINGIPTLAGWAQYGVILGGLGCLGAVGALIFWLTLRSVGSPDVADLSSSDRSIGRPGLSVLLSGIAVVLSIGVFAIPSITKDRTCHNMFRDGRTSVAPKINIDLDVTMDDWPAVTKLLEDFAAAHGMSFRKSSQNQPKVVEVLMLSACRDDGVVVNVVEQRWGSKQYAPIMTGRGVPIIVYDLRDGPGWQPFARDLVTWLESRWPGKVRFRDGLGHLVSGDTVLPADDGSGVSR